MHRLIFAAAAAAMWGVGTVPASAQTQDLLGVWDCGTSNLSYGYRSRQATSFRLVLRQNGTFSAQGVRSVVGHTHRGSGSVQFMAQGRWRVVRGRIGVALFLNGTQVAINGFRGRFTFGTVVRSPRLMAYRHRAAAYQTTSTCRR